MTATIKPDLDIQGQLESVKQRAKILDPDWVYTSAVNTDVTKTWRKFGWKPLAERLEESKDESTGR